MSIRVEGQTRKTGERAAYRAPTTFVSIKRRVMRSKTTRFLVVVLLAATALAACGDDSGSTGSPVTSGSTSVAPSAGGSSTTTGTAPTGAPYKIGIPVRLSGTSAIVYQKAVPNAAEAWEKWVNAHGGINGHPVKVILGDTAGDAAKGLTTAKKMVETDDVSMLHIEDPTLDNTLAPYAAQQKVAVASPIPYYPVWYSTPNWFPLGISFSDDFFNAAAKTIQGVGKKSVGAIVCAEVASCGQSIDALGKAVAPTGVRFDGGVKIAAAAPNYTAECLALKAKGTEMLYIAIAIDSAARVIKDCALQGYKPDVFMPIHTLDPRIQTLAPDTNVLSVQEIMPWFADTPALKDFNDAVKQYGDPSTVNEVALYTWTALEFFREAVTKAKLGESPSRAEVNAALANNKTNIGGIAPDLSFTGPDQPAPKSTKCYFVSAYSGGKFTLPDGDKRQCLT